MGTSNDPRAGIQNGFWGIKYLIVIGSMIASFWIPDGSFGTVWMWFGLIGGFLLILIQLVLIIDFAHSWAEAWYGNYQEDESKGWLAPLLHRPHVRRGHHCHRPHVCLLHRRLHRPVQTA